MSYNTTTAVLTLRHDFPTGNEREALVDARLLLQSLTVAETRIGEWVNVIGYITSQSPAKAKTTTTTVAAGTTTEAMASNSRGQERGRARGKGDSSGRPSSHYSPSPHTSIQAILLWSAGAVNTTEYAAVLSDLATEEGEEAEEDARGTT